MTDNKSLEDYDRKLFDIFDECTTIQHYAGESYEEFQWGKAREAIKELRTKDLKKLSFHFGIPIEDLEGALRSKE